MDSKMEWSVSFFIWFVDIASSLQKKFDHFLMAFVTGYL